MICNFNKNLNLLMSPLLRPKARYETPWTERSAS